MIKPLRSTIAIVIPEEDQNYILNPSAETTGNFAALAGTTVTRVTTYQKYGLYSYEVNSNADNEGISLTLLAYPNAMAYVAVRARGQLPPAWDTSLDNTNYHELRLLEKIDSNWNLYGAIIPASQANGSTTLYIRQNGAGSGLFYLDGVQVSSVIDGRHYTTYIDGTQEGCGWLGAPHASASMRSGDSRAGGVVTSFWEGFNFFPEKALGMATTPEELNIDSYAFLPGGELNSSKIPPREFTIIGYFLADTVEELHEHAQRLELELGLNTYPGRQPVRLRYSGARVLKEISANYTGGLEGDLPIFYNDDWSQEDEAWVRNYKFKMRTSIQWVALDPFWYEVGESVTLLDTNDSATFRVVAGRLRSTGQWDPLGSPNAAGTYNSIRAIVEDDTYIYFGGDFDNFNNIAAADNIVRYNKQTGVYSAIDAGLNNTVFAMALASNGDLYVGGSFTNASGVVAADFLCVLAAGASAFAAVGTPDTGAAAIVSVNALIFDAVGNLYIGGEFTNWSDVAAADNIVMWNGTIYTALATGRDDIVNALAVAQDKVTLYVAGDFTGFASTWDGTSFTSIPNVPESINALAVGLNNILYLGAVSLYSWNGSSLQELGVVSDTIRSLTIGRDGLLHVGGNFSSIEDVIDSNLRGYTTYNGYGWLTEDIQIAVGSSVFALLTSSRDVDSLINKNYTIYLGFNTSGTNAFAGLVAAQNEGSISAFPKIIYTRSGGTGATIQTLRNERTGRELLFNYSLLDGESLIIDLNPKNRTIISSFFGTRMGAILANSDFSTWQLLPNNNNVTSFVSENGSPAVTSWLLWRDTYRGWN